VGFWKVTFTAEGNTEGPPDDTPIDSGYVQWHSDGTEIMNSGRPPQNGNICLGVGKEPEDPDTRLIISLMERYRSHEPGSNRAFGWTYPNR
jgi:hypothetical protein